MSPHVGSWDLHFPFSNVYNPSDTWLFHFAGDWNQAVRTAFAASKSPSVFSSDKISPPMTIVES